MAMSATSSRVMRGDDLIDRLATRSRQQALSDDSCADTSEKVAFLEASDF